MARGGVGSHIGKQRNEQRMEVGKHQGGKTTVQTKINRKLKRGKKTRKVLLLLASSLVIHSVEQRSDMQSVI